MAIAIHRSTHRSARHLRYETLSDVILNWLALRRQRQQLGRLDAHILCDIGLTPHQARTEARRPMWDSPDHWHERTQDQKR